MKFFLKNSYVWNFENEIEDQNENWYSQLRRKVFHKIDFTDYAIHKDHPQSWEWKPIYVRHYQSY